VYGGDVDSMMNELKRLLKGIPHTIIEDRERYFQTAIHLIFNMFKMQCRSEAALCDGRIDSVLETNKLVYLFEFKFNGSEEAALKQIDTKEYLFPWEGSGKRLFKIGVNFTSEERNINDWKYVEGLT
jgi:thiamine pyrophosphokinase